MRKRFNWRSWSAGLMAHLRHDLPCGCIVKPRETSYLGAELKQEDDYLGFVGMFSCSQTLLVRGSRDDCKDAVMKALHDALCAYEQSLMDAVNKAQNVKVTP